MKLNIKAISYGIFKILVLLLMLAWVTGFMAFGFLILPSIFTICDGWYGSEAWQFVSLIPLWFLLTQAGIVGFVVYKVVKFL